MNVAGFSIKLWACKEHFRVHRHHLSFQQLGNYLHGALHTAVHRHHLVDWLVGVGGLFSWLVGWWAIQLAGVGGLYSWLVSVGYLVRWLVGGL